MLVVVVVGRGKVLLVVCGLWRRLIDVDGMGY